MPNNNPDHYQPIKKMLRVVIWHWRFEQIEKLSEIKLPLPNILSESQYTYCIHSRESFMHLNIITFNSKFPRKLHTCKIAQKVFSFAVQVYLSFGKILGKISHLNLMIMSGGRYKKIAIQHVSITPYIPSNT